VFHFDKGRPNKHLEHIAGCERGKGGKKKSSKSSSYANTCSFSDAAASSGTVGRNSHSLSLEATAASGCKKCQQELATGTKSKKSHDDCCPRKQTRKEKHTLEDAAAFGCKKCQLQLATGEKTSQSHHEDCPRKGQKRSQKGDKQSASNDKPRPAHQHQDDETFMTESITKSSKFDVGTVVFVRSRTWTGINKPGGVARITKVHLPSSNSAHKCIRYDVAYVIETRREKMIEEQFISLHTDYVSPSKDFSTEQTSGELDSSSSDEENSQQHSKKDQRQSKSNSTPVRTKTCNNATNDIDEIFISSAEKRDEHGNPLSDCEFKVELHVYSELNFKCFKQSYLLLH
jgi:hypothetical protein